MIRPITCVTFLLACASGLYLYQTKHKVHVLDTQIDQVVHQTAQVREQTRVLHAEWTLLDQPDRLQQLAPRFLTLQPTKPQQFASAADLDQRLPVPLPPEPEAPEGEPAAVVASAAPIEPAPPPAAPAPVQQAPARETVAAAAHVVERPVVHLTEHVASPVRPTLAAAHIPAMAPAPARPTPPRVVAAAVSRPVPVYQPSVAQPAQRSWRQAAPAYGGSMLGMARAAAPPPPAPAPIWADWNR